MINDLSASLPTHYPIYVAIVLDSGQFHLSFNTDTNIQICEPSRIKPSLPLNSSREHDVFNGMADRIAEEMTFATGGQDGRQGCRT